jgi:hypothetical protein
MVGGLFAERHVTARFVKAGRHAQSERRLQSVRPEMNNRANLAETRVNAAVWARYELALARFRPD